MQDLRRRPKNPLPGTEAEAEAESVIAPDPRELLGKLDSVLAKAKSAQAAAERGAQSQSRRREREQSRGCGCGR